MQKATYDTLMDFRSRCAEGTAVTQDDSPIETRESSRAPKMKCKGGRGCVRGMEGSDGKCHYIKFSRRQNVICSCWK